MILAAMMIGLAGDDVAALIDRYREQTRAEIRCEQTSARDEILVCGARRADRYRVPFIAYEAGDPRHEGVYEQAERLQAKTTPCHDHSAYLVGCGMVGVSATSRFGAGGFSGPRLRPLAR